MEEEGATDTADWTCSRRRAPLQALGDVPQRGRLSKQLLIQAQNKKERMVVVVLSKPKRGRGVGGGGQDGEGYGEERGGGVYIHLVP